MTNCFGVTYMQKRLGRHRELSCWSDNVNWHMVNEYRKSAVLHAT